MINESYRRPREVARLNNPAFCACLIYSFVKTYEKYAHGGVPVSLAFLVLPIVLDPDTQNSFSMWTSFSAWLESNPSLSIDVPRFARSYIVITKESLEFLFACGLCSLNSDGAIYSMMNRSFQRRIDANEKKPYYKAAKCLGRMFALVSNESLIYSCLGVRP